MTGLAELVGLSWPGGSPENTGLIIAVIFGAYFAALWLAAVVWTGRDIRRRSDDMVTQIVAVLIVLAFNFPGWVLYRVLRPPHTLEQRRERELEERALLHDLREISVCPRCGGRVGDDFLACPQCAALLRHPCAACERPLEASWNACPWCAQPVERSAPSGSPPSPPPSSPTSPPPSSPFSAPVSPPPSPPTSPPASPQSDAEPAAAPAIAGDS